jgi:transposase-like protein
LEQKLRLLAQSEQPVQTAALVCQRHGLASSLFYTWRPTHQKRQGPVAAVSADAHFATTLIPPLLAQVSRECLSLYLGNAQELYVKRPLLG